MTFGEFMRPCESRGVVSTLDLVSTLYVVHRSGFLYRNGPPG
jgi:hypothetical protein